MLPYIQREVAINIMIATIRSPLKVTYETWQALFFREVLSRLSTGRNAIWILIDPVIHIVFMLLMFNVIRMKSVGGIDLNIWIMAGILSYDTFRDTMNSSKNALKPNQILFTYRQIKPIDIILVKAAIEFFLTILVAIILFTGAALFGVNVIPHDPLAILSAVFGLWLIGLGVSLTLSVAEHLIPETAKITGLVMMPLYMCSGVILPLSMIPMPYRDWLMFNPLLHAVETARLGFSPYYHAVAGVNMTYVYQFAMVYLFFGLALQLRFKNQLMKK
jgi:capsular polysaccharide transport system permease protein